MLVNNDDLYFFKDLRWDLDTQKVKKDEWVVWFHFLLLNKQNKTTHLSTRFFHFQLFDTILLYLL
jgi:hypothetical protein